MGRRCPLELQLDQNRTQHLLDPQHVVEGQPGSSVEYFIESGLAEIAGGSNLRLCHAATNQPLHMQAEVVLRLGVAQPDEFVECPRLEELDG